MHTYIYYRYRTEYASLVSVELVGSSVPVESRFGPERGFGVTPGKLLTRSKPNPCPKSEKPPARKGFTKPNL